MRPPFSLSSKTRYHWRSSAVIRIGAPVAARSYCLPHRRQANSEFNSPPQHSTQRSCRSSSIRTEILQVHADWCKSLAISRSMGSQRIQMSAFRYGAGRSMSCQPALRIWADWLVERLCTDTWFYWLRFLYPFLRSISLQYIACAGEIAGSVSGEERPCDDGLFLWSEGYVVDFVVPLDSGGPVVRLNMRVVISCLLWCVTL